MKPAAIWQGASLLLCYPSDQLDDRADLIRAATGRTFVPFLDHVASVPRADLARAYVDTFDMNRRCCLYLTYYRDGDTRNRGASLAGLKDRYRSAGFTLSTTELPDFLPVVLEFCALTGSSDLLMEHRAGLELLRFALEDRRSPYAEVVAAVCATLPGPSPKDRDEALRLARVGPPVELVGLAPFGSRA